MSERIFQICYPIWIGTGITALLNPVMMMLAAATGGLVDSPVAVWWLGGHHFFIVLGTIWLFCIAWSIWNGIAAP